MLVIHARNDGVQPLEQGYRLATRIPEAEFLMLESRNHVLLPEEKAWPVLFDGLGRFILDASSPRQAGANLHQPVDAAVKTAS